MGILKRITPPLAAVLLLAGCSTSAPSAASAPTPTSYYGENAATIAGRIDGCEGVTAGDIGKGGPSLSSTATCTLDGRLLNINSWSTADAQASVKLVINQATVEAWWAEGTGWTVTAGADPTLQMQFENDAGGLLQRSFDGRVQTSPDLPGQKTAAETVTKSLGGEVKRNTA